MMRIHECPFCEEKVKIKQLECQKCGIGFEGDFYTSPLMALSEERQSFMELFILSSGSLKEMARILGVSYPTVRSRLDQLISELKAEMKRREDVKSDLLRQVNEGVITAEKAAEIIKNL